MRRWRISILVFVMNIPAFAETTEVELVSSVHFEGSRSTGLSLHPQAPYLAVVGHSDGNVTMVNLQTEQVIWKKPFFDRLLGYRATSVQHVSSFSSDGRLLAIARTQGRDVIVLRSADGELVVKINDTHSKESGYFDLRFSQDCRWLLGSMWRERSVGIWDVNDGREVARIVQEPPVGSIFAPNLPLAFGLMNDSQRIVHVDQSGTRIWNWKDRSVRSLFPAPRLNPFSDRPQILSAAVSEDARFSVLLLDSKNSDESKTISLAVQSNESGKLIAQTALPLPGTQFAFLQLDGYALDMRGFAAGCFFEWKAQEDQDPQVKCTKGRWLPHEYGWPNGMPFQGHIDSKFKFGFTMIDDSTIGHWRIQ